MSLPPSYRILRNSELRSRSMNQSLVPLVLMMYHYPKDESNRLLIAHDGRIFEFKIDAHAKGVAGSVRLVYVPKSADPTSIFESRCDDPTQDHLRLKDHPSTNRFGRKSLKLVSCRNGEAQNFKNSEFKDIFGMRAKRSTNILPKIKVDAFGKNSSITRKEFIYEGIYEGLAHNWLVRVSEFKFKRKGIPCDVALEYENPRGERNHTELCDGTLDGVPVVLKRVDAREAPSSYFLSTRCQWLSNKHNLVRVYDTGYEDGQDGKFFEITMEKCSYTHHMVKETTLFSESTNLKTVLRELFLAMTLLHDEKVVHGSIRPANVLQKVYRKDKYTITKLRGMGRCKFVCKSRREYLKHGDLGEYGRDFYGYGRTVLSCVSKLQHKFEDDDAQYDLDFENDVMFTNELDALKKVDGVAHDLVAKLLNWKLYGHILIELLNHPFFWLPGKYLKFLMELSDRIDAKGDEPM
ncbi:serine/threonine-protein kinase/endoribonuclease IRE1b [Tanacetum coccineum]|uniref:Serine/threonine-protein kinase/endoribonuclease IRE1b n=1 Tax=Tanacetum coccineum TaxID=301880 RepID=A0ABQ5DUY2_9ASTR